MRKKKESLKRHHQTLDNSSKVRLSLTDLNSRSMHSETQFRVGYYVQIAVGTRHNPIAEQQVHSTVSDPGLLAETATAAWGNFPVEEIGVVADKSYYKFEGTSSVPW